MIAIGFKHIPLQLTFAAVKKTPQNTICSQYTVCITFVYLKQHTN